MADWTEHPPQSQNYNSGRPTYNPLGGNLVSQDLQIERITPRGNDPIEIVKEVFEIIKEKPAETIGVMIGLYAVSFVVFMAMTLILGIIQGAFVMIAGDSRGAQTIISFLSGVSTLLIQIVFSVVMNIMIGAIYIMWFRFIRGQEFVFGNLMDIKPFILPLVVTTFMMQFAVGFGFLLLFVPGILLAFGLGIVPFLVIDKNIKYMDALKASWKLMNGHKMEYFIFSLVLMAVNIVGFIPCGLGFVVTAPLSLGAMVMFYDNIAEPGNAYASDTANAAQIFS